MDKVFGNGEWHFTLIANKTDLLVTKRLCMEEGKRTFFNWSCMVLYGTIQDHMVPYGPVWYRMDPYDP